MCHKVGDCAALFAAAYAPGVGETWKVDAQDTHAWRITGITSPQGAPEAERETFWCGRRADLGGIWFLRYRNSRFTDAFQVLCEKVDGQGVVNYSRTRPGVGSVIKFYGTEDHAWRIIEVIAPEAQTAPLYYMWAWHMRGHDWRISRTQRDEKVAYQRLVQCKKIDYADNFRRVKTIAVGAKFTLPGVKTHAWEIVGTERTDAPALEAFWCGMRADMDNNWFIGHFDNQITDAFQVWCEKVPGAGVADQSADRPGVGDVIKFCGTDDHAWRITEIPA